MASNLLRASAQLGLGKLSKSLMAPGYVVARTAASLSSDKLTTVKTQSKRHCPTDKSQLGFGKYFADHMLEIDWSQEDGWKAPTISPFHDFKLSPAALVFHYGQEIFEGMKAYKGVDGKVRLFRPEMNIARLNKSAARLALPTFDGDEFRKCLEELIRLDKDCIPEGRGFSLYVRPTLIATEGILGVKATKEAKLYVITSPSGGYYKSDDSSHGVRLLAQDEYIRAFPGGVGDAKCGGNYAPTIKPQQEAAGQGFDQILWLFGGDHEITEVGTMNFFGLIKTPEGETELITAPLDGTILEGVTRRSVLDLAYEFGEFKVSERSWTMGELKTALDEDRVLELFGSGTAATVSPVREISYKGEILAIPSNDAFSKRCAERLSEIQYGIESDHPWAPVIA